MYWKNTISLENGRFLAVMFCKVQPTPTDQWQYREFAGVGKTEAEAKTKALQVRWRELLRARRGFD